MPIIILILGIPAIVAGIETLYYISYNKALVPPFILRLVEIIYLLILPQLFFLTTDRINNCCSGSAFFSPDHSLTAYTLIITSIFAYFYSSCRKTLAGPLLELIINCVLIIAIALNILMGFHHSEGWLSAIHVPIILLYIRAIAKNHTLCLSSSCFSEYNMRFGAQKMAWKILNVNILKKIPLLMLICLPLLALLSACLLLTGQKPDSAIKAFTDTYKHGFSQLNSECLNAVCPGGHFLCTIAAKGHPGLVKPIRLGRRADNIIICNRQLLISNAFEELIQQKLPQFHKPVRRSYNQIGRAIHRYYGILNRKWVSDLIYLLMKPLEWIFLMVLYLADKSPENRIVRQYIDLNENPSLTGHVAKI